MWQDLATALALVLILEGLLPAVAPHTWARAMRDAMRLGPRGLRILGFSLMLSGALLLHVLN